MTSPSVRMDSLGFVDNRHEENVVTYVRDLNNPDDDGRTTKPAIEIGIKGTF